MGPNIGDSKHVRVKIILGVITFWGPLIFGWSKLYGFKHVGDKQIFWGSLLLGGHSVLGIIYFFKSLNFWRHLTFGVIQFWGPLIFSGSKMSGVEII